MKMRRHLPSPRAIDLWAIICVGTRTQWIYYPSVGRTRSEAWKNYCADWPGVKTFSRERRLGRLRQPGGIYCAQVWVHASHP